MNGKWWDSDNSTIYRPLIPILSRCQPEPEPEPQPQRLPQPQPMPQTNNNLTPPANPNPSFVMAEEDSHGSTEAEDHSSGSQTANSRRRKKAKPAPVSVETESPCALQSLVLEFTDGSDIMGTLRTYAYENHCGVTVLFSSGNVKDVIIRSRVAPSGVITLRGIHQILSIHGSILPTPSPPEDNALSILIADRFGVVLGGIIRGRLVASGPVKVIAGTFSSATLMRMPDTIPGDATAASSSTSAGPTPP